MTGKPYSQDVHAIAVIGRGRWAKVYIDVLESLSLPYQVVIVSKSGSLQELQKHNRNIFFVSSIEELLSNHTVKMAIVVNSIRSHFDSAQELINEGIPVLIEKPICLEESQVNILYDKAHKQDICIMPALTFTQCSYIQNFSHIVSNCNEGPEKIIIEWADPYGEIRYGDTKSYDFTISIVQDVIPHIWSILSTVLDSTDINFNIESCSIRRGGQYVKLTSRVNGISCDIFLERNAGSRRRFVSAKYKSFPKVELDFTKEPGTLNLKNQNSSGDQYWETGTIHPIQRQLELFISQVESKTKRVVTKALSLDTIAALEQSDTLLKRSQKSWLSSLDTPFLSEDISYAISELAVPDFYKAGLGNLKDKQVFKNFLLNFTCHVEEQKLPSKDWDTAYTNLIGNYIQGIMSNE